MYVCDHRRGLEKETHTQLNMWHTLVYTDRLATVLHSENKIKTYQIPNLQHKLEQISVHLLTKLLFARQTQGKRGVGPCIRYRDYKS